MEVEGYKLWFSDDSTLLLDDSLIPYFKAVSNYIQDMKPEDRVIDYRNVPVLQIKGAKNHFNFFIELYKKIQKQRHGPYDLIALVNRYNAEIIENYDSDDEDDRARRPPRYPFASDYKPEKKLPTLFELLRMLDFLDSPILFVLFHQRAYVLLDLLSNAEIQTLFPISPTLKRKAVDVDGNETDNDPNEKKIETPHYKREKLIFDVMTTECPGGSARIVNERIPQFVKPVQCGDSHTMILSPDGVLFSNGQNKWGQLGLKSSTTTNYDPHICFRKVVIPRVLAFSTCNTHSMALTTEGLFAAGFHRSGQEGEKNKFRPLQSSRFFVPVSKLELKGEVLALCCGGERTIVLTTTGVFKSGEGLEKEGVLTKQPLRFDHRDICDIQWDEKNNQFVFLLRNGSVVIPKFSPMPTSSMYNQSKYTVAYSSLTKPILSMCHNPGSTDFLLLANDGTLYSNGMSVIIASNVNSNSASFDQVKPVEGKVLKMAVSSTHAVIETTTGLYASGSKGIATLSVFSEDTNKDGFQRMISPIMPDVRGILGISCGKHFTVIMTTYGIFVCGYNESFGSINGKAPFIRTLIDTLTKLDDEKLNKEIGFLSDKPENAEKNKKKKENKKTDFIHCECCFATAHISVNSTAFCSKNCYLKHSFNSLLITDERKTQ